MSNAFTVKCHLRDILSLNYFQLVIIQNIKCFSKKFILCGIYWIFLFVVLPCNPGLLKFSYIILLIFLTDLYLDILFIYICIYVTKINNYEMYSKYWKLHFSQNQEGLSSGCHSTSNLLYWILQELQLVIVLIKMYLDL